MANSGGDLWAGERSSSEKSLGTLPRELSIKEIEDRVGTKTVEKWIQKAYQRFLKAKAIPKAKDQRHHLNRRIKGLSEVSLNEIRERALEKIHQQ